MLSYAVNMNKIFKTVFKNKILYNKINKPKAFFNVQVILHI